jgi:hypothetical protein
MRLSKVEIAGYRSISANVTLILDPAVTVLLGANDHGKTNLLDAMTHLNAETTFDAERDLNWDRIGQEDAYPFLSFEFDLDDHDRENLLKVAQELQSGEDPSAAGAAAAASAERATSTAVSPPPSGDPSVSVDPSSAPAPVPLTLQHVPTKVSCFKKGVTDKLHFARARELPNGSVTKFLTASVPRVELIRARDTVPDSTTRASLDSEEHEFMRGIFYYAGLEKREFDGLFSQTDATLMRLEKASEGLNATLRRNWSQGSDLQFRLAHDSKTDNIVLRIKDPAVTDRLVRASQRSSGFTHFFTLKTVLHARQKEHPANSYILLFDEPGIYLHPSGQYDLLQVLDTIGRQNQIVYSTHSLFMLNKTFPARHRLIVKTIEGTKVEGKPYVGRWASAIEALGLSLTGTILFAQYILMTEGDSDPMYLPAVLQKLVALNQANVDLNAFSVISTETSRNTDALIRLLSEANPPPKLAVLLDGDDGGKARLKALQPILKTKEMQAKSLSEGTTIEDYLPLVGELYVRAVADYVAKVMETYGKAPNNLDDHRAEFRKSFREAFEEGKVTKGVANWAAEAGRRLGGLEQAPSKVGIAREYVRLLEDTAADKFTPQGLQRPLKLLEWIREMLPIPDVREAKKEILRTETPQP